MVGVKGAGGPPPKRSAQRRRTNTPAAGEPKQAQGITATRPPADPEWHAVAKLWFESLALSGQAIYYQASDWGLAYVLAESISRELNPQPIVVGSGDSAHTELVRVPMKGATLSAFLKGCTGLMVSEGDRRRSALELTTVKPEPDEQTAGVTSMASWKAGTA